MGSIFGDAKEINDGASGDCVGKYIHVRVVINVCKSLRRILYVDVLRDGKESTMLLRYERLPEHCFSCGRIGHVVRKCSIAASSYGPEDFNVLFGPWHKATSLSKFRQNCQHKEGVRTSGTSSGLNNITKIQADVPEVSLSSMCTGGKKGNAVIVSTDHSSSFC